ncbi:hypothetical protein Zmor_001641 [Zophobas morio]|uniref:Uncharacterized protein n=1 Tax=Zophobas morio TaxID=2755281 RepID=A0AA38MT36_9CUCU|nr:hypothetical protein Zmor_001641 [Zophobas morio]
MLDRNSRSMKLSKLYPGTRYLICVLALGNWASYRREITQSRSAVRNPDNSSARDSLEIFNDVMLPLLVDSQTSKCTEVSTLVAPDGVHVGLGGLSDYGLGVS